MNEPENQPEKQPDGQPENQPMPDYELLQRHFQERHHRIPRQSIQDSIAHSRSTLITNLVIEIASGLVLLIGILYAVIFLYSHRNLLDPGRFKLYLEIITFFTLAWFTYVGFKVRAKYRLLRKYSRPPEDDQHRL